MNEQKMREAFEAWFQSEQGAPYDGMWSFARAAWQSATAATQRDAMAVAEAVRKSMIDVAYNSQTPHGTITGEMESVDLAAIVEAVLPGVQEPVNQQQEGVYRKFNVSRTDRRDQIGGDRHGAEYFVLDVTNDKFAKPALAAYVAACRDAYPSLADDMVRRYAIAIAAAEAVRSVCRHRIADARNPVVTSGYLCVDCGVLFSAADHGERQQPASAKQQGEPVTFEDADQLARQYSTATQPDEYHFTKAQLACFVQCLFDAADGSMPLHPKKQGEPVAYMIDWPNEPELGHYFAEAPSDTGRSRALYTIPPAPECSVPDGWQAGLWRYGFTNEAFGLMNNGPYVLLEQVEMALLAAAPEGGA